MLTPLDLETTVFKRVWRGYSKKEVQEFMQRLIPEYERLYKENLEYKEKIADLENKLSYYMKIEQTLNNTLLTAQDASEDIKVGARKEAELIIREAELKAKQLKGRAAQEIEEEIRLLAGFKQQIDYFRTQFKSLLTTHLEMLEKNVPVNLQAELQKLWDKYVPPSLEILNREASKKEPEKTGQKEPEDEAEKEPQEFKKAEKEPKAAVPRIEVISLKR